jgi:hypothetical protein
MSSGTTLFGWPAVAATWAVTLFAFIGTKVDRPWLQYKGNISYGLYAYPMFWIMTVDQLLSIRYCQNWTKKKCSAGMLPVLFLDEIG